MNIKGIDKKATVSRNKVAFLVDEDLTPELLNEVKIAEFTVTGEGRTLVVSSKPGANFIDEIALVEIHNALLAAKKAIVQKAAERQRMLEGISLRIGLPLV